MRMSTDEIQFDHVWNGFDYKLQVWVVDGIIQDCNHPKEMKEKECCNGFMYAGQSIFLVPGAQIRE